VHDLACVLTLLLAAGCSICLLAAIRALRRLHTHVANAQLVQGAIDASCARLRREAAAVQQWHQDNQVLLQRLSAELQSLERAQSANQASTDRMRAVLVQLVRAQQAPASAGHGHQASRTLEPEHARAEARR